MAPKLKDLAALLEQRRVEDADRLREEAAEKGKQGQLPDNEREDALKKMREAGIPIFGGGPEGGQAGRA